MTGFHAELGPLRLSDLTPADAARLLAATPRLLLPVGTMAVLHHALPLGAETLIVDRVADAVSARLAIVRAPVIPFGVHARSDPDAPGSASLTRKTLHRVINELIAAWETEARVHEFILLTAHAADAHLEALSTIRSRYSVRLLDVLARSGYSDVVDTEGVELPLLSYLTQNPSSPTAIERGQRIFESVVARLVTEIGSANRSRP